MSRKIITGIDVGDYSVKVVVSEFRTGIPYPRVLGVSKRPARGIHRGHITDPEEAGRSVEDAVGVAENMAKERVRNAYVAASGVGVSSAVAEGSTLVSRADSEITDHDVRLAIDAAQSKVEGMQNKKILEVMPISFSLDGKKIMKSPRGMHGTKLEVRVLFTTCFAHHLEELVDVIESVKIGVADIVPASLAASFVSASRMQKIAGAIIADIGSETTQIAVFEDGLPCSIETFEIGSQDITNDIALGLKIDLAEAEDIKLEKSSHVFAQKKLDEIIEARLSDIFELIDTHLKRLGKSELLPAGIILCGGGSCMQNIEHAASRELNLPSRVASPLWPQNIEFSEEQKRELARVLIKDPSFAAAYGLAIYGDRPTVNEHSLREPLFRTSAWNTPLRWLKNFLP